MNLIFPSSCVKGNVVRVAFFFSYSMYWSLVDPPNLRQKLIRWNTMDLVLSCHKSGFSNVSTDDEIITQHNFIRKDGFQGCGVFLLTVESPEV